MGRTGKPCAGMSWASSKSITASGGKVICIIYESGMATLRGELLGEGSPDTALPAAAELPRLPAAVQEENEQLRLAMDEIARITREITE